MTLRKSVFWSFGGQGVSSVAAFVTSVLLAHVLTPHEFGIYGIAIAAQAILQIFAAFGLGNYIVRHENLQPADLESTFTINAIISIGLAGMMVAVSFMAGNLLGDPGAGRVLRILALGPIIMIPTCRPAAMLQRDMAFQVISVIGMINVLLISAVTLASAWTGASYMSAAYGLISGTVFQAIAYNIVGRQHASFRLNLVNWRLILGFGLNMLSVQGILSISTRFSDIVLGRVLGLSQLGFYGRANGVALIIAENIYATAARISFVKLAQDARQGLPIHPVFLRSIYYIMGVLWPAQLGIAILARPLMYHVYGSQWTPAATPLALLMIAQFIAAMTGMNWELFTVRNEMKRQTRLELIRATVGLGFFVLIVPFGLWAAAAAKVAEAILGLVLYYRHVARLAGTAPGQITTVWRDNMIVTVAAIVPALALMLWNGWLPETPVPSMAAAILAGIACWVIALAAIGHPLYAEGIHVLATVRRGLRLAINRR